MREREKLTAEKLLEAIGEISDDKIKEAGEAAEAGAGRAKVRQKRLYAIRRWSALAVSACVVVAAGWNAGRLWESEIKGERQDAAADYEMAIVEEDVGVSADFDSGEAEDREAEADQTTDSVIMESGDEDGPCEEPIEWLAAGEVRRQFWDGLPLEGAEGRSNGSPLEQTADEMVDQASDLSEAEDAGEVQERQEQDAGQEGTQAVAEGINDAVKNAWDAEEPPRDIAAISGGSVPVTIVYRGDCYRADPYEVTEDTLIAPEGEVFFTEDYAWQAYVIRGQAELVTILVNGEFWTYRKLDASIE